MGLNLKELKAIIKLCRKTGILYYKGNGFEFRLSKSALELPKVKTDSSAADGIPKISGVPSPEQMMVWSSLPHVG